MTNSFIALQRRKRKRNNVTELFRLVYNIVQASITSCHSAEEDASGDQTPQLECVSKKALKSCHVKRLMVLTVTLDEVPMMVLHNWMKSPFSVEKAAAIEDLKSKGASGSNWTVCAPL